jgi:hypothetical protein
MLERHGRTQSGRRRVAPRQAPVADGEYNYAFKLMERRRRTYIGALIAEYKQKLSLCNNAQVQRTLQQLKLAQSLARSAAMRTALEGEKISTKGRQTLAKALGHGTRRTCIARSSPSCRPRPQRVNRLCGEAQGMVDSQDSKGKAAPFTVFHLGQGATPRRK